MTFTDFDFSRVKLCPSITFCFRICFCDASAPKTIVAAFESVLYSRARVQLIEAATAVSWLYKQACLCAEV